MSRARVVVPLLLCLLLAGCSKDRAGVKSAPKGGRPYDREALRKAVLGKPLDEVRELLGPPDDVQTAMTPAPHEGFWQYNGGGTVKETTYLWFGGGRVNEITY